jgi:hypothetical protein
MQNDLRLQKLYLAAEESLKKIDDCVDDYWVVHG